MSGTSSSSSWSALLSDLLGSDPCTDIGNEANFQRRFREECFKKSERDTERLLARFQRLHAQIISFVNALDKSAVLTQTNLSTVFWSKAFEVIVKAFGTGQKDKLFKEYLPKLSEAIPFFSSAALPLFPSNESVQKPLQTIFLEFTECYALLIRALDSQQDSDAQSFFVKIGAVTKSMNILKQEWETAIDEANAAQRLAIELLSRNSLSSYAHSTTGMIPAHTTLVKFELIEKLGEGRYGTVYSVREETAKGLYAVKQILLDNQTHTDRLLQQFQTESNVMRELRHLHIATVQFSCIENNCLKLFMSPIADCNLLQYMEKCSENRATSLDMTNLSSWFGCLVSALDFAHLNRIVHKDIKPTNILVKDSQVLLTDFGCAEVFEDFNIPRSAEPLEKTGTEVYWPPQLSSGNKRDVWSLGCVFSEMLTIRQGRSLNEFRSYRRNDAHESPHAFRGCLVKVRQWLDDTVPSGNALATLLKDQTLLMLEPNMELRREAIDIKRGLRSHWDGQLAFCRACF